MIVKMNRKTYNQVILEFNVNLSLIDAKCNAILAKIILNLSISYLQIFFKCLLIPNSMVPGNFK